jgi:hypothetical protein
MHVSEARKPLDCKKLAVCEITVTVPLFFLPPSVGGADVVVIKRGQKITWILDSGLYNFGTIGIRFAPEGRAYYTCKPESPRKITCENAEGGPPGVEVYKYAIDVKGLPDLDPWVVRE